MAVPVTCPGCSRRLNAPPTIAGQMIRCPACAATFVFGPDGAVPGGGEPEAAPEHGAPEAPPAGARPPTGPVVEAEFADAVAAEPPRPARPGGSLPARGRPDFRRPIRKRSSTGLWVGLALAASFVVLAAAGAAAVLLYGVLKPSIPDGDWAQFTTPDGACSVLMPGAPVLNNAALNGAPGSKYLLVRTKEDVFFAVVYVDLPTAGVPPNLLTIAAAAERNALQQKIGGTAGGDQDVSVLGYAGRELQIRAAPPQRGVLIERLFLVPNGSTTRLYMVGTGGPIIEPGKGAAAKFFDSLVIKAPPAGPGPVAVRPNPPGPVPPNPPVVQGPPAAPPALKPKPKEMLTEIAKVDGFLTCAVDTARKTAFFCGGDAHLRAVSYPDFKVKGTYAIGGAAYRSALDAKHGKLYLAVTDPKNLEQIRHQFGFNPNVRVIGAATDIHVYDVNGVVQGATEPGAELQPAAVVPLTAKIESLLLSPDGRWLYYLDVTDPTKVKAGRVDTASMQKSPEIALAAKVDALRLAPGGGKLYAKAPPHDGVQATFQLLDPAAWKVEKSFTLDLNAFDVWPDDAGLLYVTWGRGGNVDLTVVDTKTASIAARWPNFPDMLLVRLSPDGKLLYLSGTGGSPGTFRVLQVSDKPEDGRKDVQVVYGDAFGYDFYPTPDGEYVLMRGGKVYKVNR